MGEGAGEVIRVEYWSNSFLVGEISCLTNEQERIKQMKKQHDPFFFFYTEGVSTCITRRAGIICKYNKAKSIRSNRPKTGSSQESKLENVHCTIKST